MKLAKNVNCFACDKEKLSKDEIGLNKKMIGTEVKHFYCLDCFADYLDVSTEELLMKIEDFKEEGCKLFS